MNFTYLINLWTLNIFLSQKFEQTKHKQSNASEVKNQRIRTICFIIYPFIIHLNKEINNKRRFSLSALTQLQKVTFNVKK